VSLHTNEQVAEKEQSMKSQGDAMINFNLITYFHNRQRIVFLEEFRSRILEYFENTDINTMGRYDSKHAKRIRQLINKDLVKAVGIIEAANSKNGKSYNYISVEEIDLVRNIFSLPSKQSSATVSDVVDKAIGVYENDKTRSVIRTFNPLFYIDHLLRIIAYVLMYPLRILFPSKYNAKLEDLFRYLEYIWLIYQISVFIISKYFPSVNFFK
jgi:hypothetical protein